MARPANVSHYVVSGTLPHAEQFAWGFWFNEAPANAPDATAAAVAVRNALWTNSSALLNVLPSTASYRKVTCYSYPDTQPTAAYVGESTEVIGNGSANEADLPLQTCQVITLRSALAGRRHRGRFYLPAIENNLINNQFNPTASDARLTALKTFFDTINASAAVPGQLAVVSAAGGFSITVRSLTADTKPDIQRRRANKAPALATTTVNLV